MSTPMHLQFNRDSAVADFLRGKRVAYVGPSPHLLGSGMGKVIDSYDVVVRINEPVGNPKDYGSRTDIMVHNLNNRYTTILETFLDSHPNVVAGLKFIFCGENYESPDESTQQPNTMRNFNNHIRKFNIPLYALEQSIRSQLLLRICPKQYVEGGVQSTMQFNNGYCGLLMVLNYDVSEVFVTGLNFYNFGLAKGHYVEDEDGTLKDSKTLVSSEKKELKYNPSYIEHYNKGGNPEFGINYTPLHDQLAQIRHFRDVVLPCHPCIRLDQELKKGLFTKSLQKRLDWHTSLSLTDEMGLERFITKDDPPTQLHLVIRGDSGSKDGTRCPCDREGFQAKIHTLTDGSVFVKNVPNELMTNIHFRSVLVVISGTVDIVLYDTDNELIAARTLSAGDVCLTFMGKNKMVARSNSVIYEFSSGQNVN